MDNATLTMLLTLAALLVGALLPTIWRAGQALATLKRSVEALTPDLRATLEAVRKTTQGADVAVSELAQSLPAARQAIARIEDVAERLDRSTQGPGWGAVLAGLAPVIMGAIETWSANANEEPPAPPAPDPAAPCAQMPPNQTPIS